jgi:tetratricopeptide (TPR) repeat protein
MKTMVRTYLLLAVLMGCVGVVQSIRWIMSFPSPYILCGLSLLPAAACLLAFKISRNAKRKIVHALTIPICLLALGVWGVTTLAGEWVRGIQSAISAAESKVTAPAGYEPAAKALALLCQSDPFYFRDEPSLAPAWTPPKVLKLNPSWVQISPGGARVEFGGGFHHFGYDLRRDTAADSDGQNGWTLHFYSEDSPGRSLITFVLKATDHVELEPFITGALAEFKRRASLPRNTGDCVRERLVFLLKFNEVDLARKSIREYAAANPDDWADQMLAYIIDAKTDPSASARLDAWAQKKNSFSAWLLAAYAYNVAGDNDAAERSVTLALAQSVDDPDWLSTNARHRGAVVCLQLFEAHRYSTCASLCEALLSYDGGSYQVPQIIAIRDLARHASASDPPPAPPALEKGSVFEPFKGIHLSRLVMTEAASSPASSRPLNSVADPNQVRMIEYLDRRIAADPGSWRTHLEKICFLLSIERNAEAAASCRAAARVLPKWWRPQMGLLLFADPGSREEAEAAFRKWVEDNPAFIHWWYLCRYYRDTERDIDAVAALRNAVKYPLESVDEDETWVPAAFAFDAARYAYQQKQYTLVLDIARVWSSPRGIYNYVSDDMYAFRAAAELALGDFSAAKADADRVVKAASEHAIWAENLTELQKAAHAEDQSFRYEAGGPPTEWSPFPTPLFE